MSVALPKNCYLPCAAKGGWFYVSRASIEVVTESAGQREVVLTRTQLEAALKIMGSKSKIRAKHE